MISVIISSAHPATLTQVNKNIEATISVPFEIIAFENIDGAKGICEVYNEGARRAKYDILCFMHEDIEMKTADWGSKVIAHFDDNPLLGLLGIVGCSYKSKSPSGWVCYGSRKILHYNYIQTFKHKKQPVEHHYLNPDNATLSKVATIDGLWFCARKSVSLEYPFDEGLLKGFHGYDMDFSLAVNQKYEVAIAYDILLNHFSEGNFKQDWIMETLKVANKWKDHLPLNVAGLDKKESTRVEVRTYENLIKKMLHNGMSLAFCWRTVSQEFYKESEFYIKFRLYYYLFKKMFGKVHS